MSSSVVIKVSAKERRSEPRMIYCDAVNVTAYNTEGIACYLENVECVEVSDHGVRLSLSVRIPPGQQMLISASQPGLRASNAAFQVVWCKPTKDGYLLGGKLISSSEDWQVLS